MALRTRIFVDYWNFQLNWNERAQDARCDWLALPWALIRATEKVARLTELSYEGTHIYASVDPNNENLLNWLESFLDRQAGFMVSTARLTRRPRPVRCSTCGREQEVCPECGELFTLTASKGLTTRMVCDLLALDHAGAYDIAVLASSDTELVPAVAHLVRGGAKLVHAGWRDSGLDLARESWASFELDPLIPELVRG